jgi:hypothetical protein
MSSAEGPAPAAVGGEQHPETGPLVATPAEKARIALSRADHLAKLASGAATTFLIGGIGAVVLALFPLRFTDSQWQLGVFANLVANGSWILIGLVLLHLAGMLQPRNAPLNQRLLLWRRLAALAAVGYLVIAPLQVVITWIDLDSTSHSRERVITTNESKLKAYRDALLGAGSFTELKQRLAAIPGAQPLPEKASQIPYDVVRERLLQQLGQAESRFRQQVQTIQPGPNLLELGRQTARTVLASLMLAFGFATGAEGLFGQASLLESLKLLFRKARSKPAKGSRLKGLRNQWQWLQQRLTLPNGRATRSNARSRQKSRRRPLVLKIPRQLQFWRKKRSSRRRVRVPR